MTFAIGDVHGCSTKALDLVEACLEFSQDQPCCFIFLGDYVDRGEDSRGVVNFLKTLEERQPDQVLCLRGNHEDMLLRAATGNALDEEHWFGVGGDATLASYQVAHARDIPPDHLEWLANRPLLFRDDHRVYAHAGIIPGVPLDRQPPKALLWIRDEFLLSERDHGVLVVHGHTPLDTGLPDLRHNRLNLDTAACFGGPLTAAAFDGTRREPIAFITDDGTVTRLANEVTASSPQAQP